MGLEREVTLVYSSKANLEITLMWQIPQDPAGFEFMDTKWYLNGQSVGIVVVYYPSKRDSCCTKTQIPHLCLQPCMHSAYRAHHSMETVLLRLHGDILRAGDRKEAVVLTLVDLSAAFDTIDLWILLHCREHGIRIHGVCYTCSIGVGQCSCHLHHQRTGLLVLVCLGLCLGPIALCSSVHLPSVNDCSQPWIWSTLLFANDSQLYVMFRPLEQCDGQKMLTKLTACVEDIQQWMRINMLNLDDAKIALSFVPPTCGLRLPSSQYQLRTASWTITHSEESWCNLQLWQGLAGTCAACLSGMLDWPLQHLCKWGALTIQSAGRNLTKPSQQLQVVQSSWPNPLSRIWPQSAIDYTGCLWPLESSMGSCFWCVRPWTMQHPIPSLTCSSWIACQGLCHLVIRWGEACGASVSPEEIFFLFIQLCRTHTLERSSSCSPWGLRHWFFWTETEKSPFSSRIYPAVWFMTLKVELSKPNRTLKWRQMHWRSTNSLFLPLLLLLLMLVLYVRMQFENIQLLDNLKWQKYRRCL